ncbi:unnamed protein product [Sphenostylis stenocarpa]|uniref:Mitochondrial carrier protein n=1 Tax=Sphenostylis stenocarpa TaxID=92480 RepID=A0AA86RVH4_9FABA|nr:unnamed protein product [Sphenostylis stenocarpa]
MALSIKFLWVGMEAAGVGVAVEGGHGNNVKLLQQKNQQAQVGTVSQLLAGGLAGAFAKTCTAPLSRLTILFQVQGMQFDVAVLSNPSLWGEASRIVNEEGFRAFWKGNLVTIAHRLPYSAVNFYAYERYKNLLHLFMGEKLQGNTNANLFVHFVGGGLSGITSATATYPLDLLRTRLAAQRSSMYYRGISHAFKTIYREEGFLGLYKGLGATLLSVGPNIAISFSVYDGLRFFWQSRRPDDSTVMVSLACGSLSGIASSTVKTAYAVPDVIHAIFFGKIILSSCTVCDYSDIDNDVGENGDDSALNHMIACVGINFVLLEFACLVTWMWSTFPLDLVRRRMQLEGAGGRALVYNTSLFGTFKHIVRNEGLRGLYRGILPEYYKVIPSVGIVFMTVSRKLGNLISSGLQGDGSAGSSSGGINSHPWDADYLFLAKQFNQLDNFHRGSTLVEYCVISFLTPMQIGLSDHFDIFHSLVQCFLVKSVTLLGEDKVVCILRFRVAFLVFLALGCRFSLITNAEQFNQ